MKVFCDTVCVYHNYLIIKYGLRKRKANMAANIHTHHRLTGPVLVAGDRPTLKMEFPHLRFSTLIQDREHGRNLRSTTTTLCKPFTTTILAKRAFRCSASAVWNSLPKAVLLSDSVALFKSRLKTFLFSQAFSSSSAH